MKLLAKYKMLQLAAVSALLFGVLSIINAPNALAATKTWTGGSGDNWSTAGNWSPSGAPVNGDDLVFYTNSNTPILSINDIPSLSISGIAFNGTGTGAITVQLNEDLTVTGDIVSSRPTNGLLSSIGGSGDLILGSDISITNTYLTNTGTTTGGKLDLNGNELTFTTDSNYTGSTFSVSREITGSGTFVIDVRNSVSLYLGDSSYVPGGNTYSGTTVILSGTISTQAHSNMVFGSSVVNVGPTATLSLKTDGSATYTFSNTINISAAIVGQNGFLDDQLYIWADANTQTINIPNIILAGNASFELNRPPSSQAVVNLAGITANGFCVQYGAESNWQADVFLNGPPACVIGDDDSSVDVVPGAPNTGELTQSPLALAVAGIVGLGLAGLGVKRGLAFAKARR